MPHLIDKKKIVKQRNFIIRQERSMKALREEKKERNEARRDETQ
jgi:hypothetical protein